MIQGGFFSQTNNSKNKRFYFMAGLPRSGSTLLSSILNADDSKKIGKEYLQSISSKEKIKTKKRCL